MIDIVNKIVKAADAEDLLFYFPDFVVRFTVSILDYGKKIIYTGPLNRKALDQLSGNTYIATKGLPSFDFTDRLSKLKFVYSKFDREPPKNIIDLIDLYDDKEFDYC